MFSEKHHTTQESEIEISNLAVSKRGYANEQYRKGDSFDNANVLANRIMSNAVFGNNRLLFLPGFFLKDVALTFGILKSQRAPNAYATAKAQGFSYVLNLEKSLAPLDEEKLWKDFQDFDNKIRKYQMTEWEERSYTDNVQFTKESYTWLVNYLVEHKELLGNPQNNLLKGIINEMVRLYRVHSSDLEDLELLCLVIALDRDYDYIRRIAYLPASSKIDDNLLKLKILPAIDRIAKMCKEGVKIKEADTLLWELVKTWRELYIQFGEVLPPGISVEKGIELPKELKTKLTESLTKTLEKEM
ncbi:MAG: hypothetical protein ABSA75_09290 [Candidatus Bathyarchaeia archaeon]|jgi:hypothetical protein